MNKKNDIWAIVTMICMCVTTICGILSMKFDYAHDFINQYGHTVKIFGYGIYANDSYFKAPISIGTDFCILSVLVPLFFYTYLQYRKKADMISEIKLISVYAVAFYYAASIAFGCIVESMYDCWDHGNSTNDMSGTFWCGTSASGTSYKGTFICCIRGICFLL